jgi:hypothetical protein
MAERVAAIRGGTKDLQRMLRGLIAGLGTLLLVACGGANVQMHGEIPTPLVQPLPLHMGLYFEPALLDYVYEEKIENHGDWRVEVGQMQSKLFLQIGSAMFAQAEQVTSTTPGGTFNGVLAPSIADFQIAIPDQTRTDFYEVWIKYLIRVYDNKGALIAEWPLTAYGKSNQADYGFFEKTNQPAMRDATMRALRDAGAFLALRFSRVPAIKVWLDAQAQSTAATNRGTP